MNAFIKSALAVATLSLASSAALAAGAVAVQGESAWNGTTMMDNHMMGVGGTISASGITASINAFADNPALGNAAWAHTGKWFTFMTHNALDTTITLVSQIAGGIAPGFTVWRTDGQFDGGTGSTGEVPNIGSGPQQTPHSFNQIGAAGNNGTKWMTDDSISGGFSVNGILETVGYANSGDASGTTAWGENLQIGAFDGAGNVSGTVGAGFASLTLNNLAGGWYAVYVGGADGARAGSPLSLTVSQVPVPGAVYLFGSALLGLIASGRRKMAA